MSGNSAADQASKWSSAVGRFVTMLLVLAVGDAFTEGVRLTAQQQRAEERQAAQQAEDERLRDAVTALQEQATDEDHHELHFADEDETRTIDVLSPCVFELPATWEERENLSGELVMYTAQDYDGQLVACKQSDWCLTFASTEEAVEYAAQELKLGISVHDGAHEGRMGDAIWYRCPVSKLDSGRLTSLCGYLEVVLSGRDIYWMTVMCSPDAYTAEVQNEMLCILNSVTGLQDEPLLNDQKQQEPSSSGGAMRAFLESLGDFRAVTVTGSGDDVVQIPQARDTLRHPCFCMITVTCEGEGPLVVKRCASDEEDGTTLIDRKAPYHGTITNLGNVDNTVRQGELRIRAEGDWSITFAPMNEVPPAQNGATYTGDTLLYLDEEELESLSFTHGDDGIFMVNAAGMTGSDRLVDENGPYEGSVAWDDPNTLLVVTADGDWSIAW